MGKSFRRYVQTNANFLGTGRYRDGIGLVKLAGVPTVIGGWDGAGGGSGGYDKTFNTQYQSSDQFATVTPIANALWNPSHSFAHCNDTAGNVWKWGSDRQPGATDADRKALYKADAITGAWSLVNADLVSMATRCLYGWGYDPRTGKKYTFGGQISYNLADGVYNNIVEISANGLSSAILPATNVNLEGIQAGHWAFFPKDNKFHGVCVGGKYDNIEGNRTYSVKHITYDPDTGLFDTSLPDFPGLPRHYGDLIYHEDDGNLWFIGGIVKPPSAGVYNSTEAWYYNGNDWAMILAETSGSIHATGLLSDGEKLLQVMGNENQRAGYFEKYEKS
jgi:hypothetical protein